MIDAGGIDVAQRHDLDKGEVHAATMRPAHHRGEFVFVDASQRHRVDLDVEAGCLRSVQPRHDFGQIAPAGDGAELRLVQRVERDVDALDAAGRQLLGEAWRAASRWW